MAFEATIVQAAANTSTGNQSFTASGFGTPQCALLLVNRATTNGSAAAHAAMSYGATDGTRQRTCSMVAKDEDEANRSVCKNDKLIVLLTPSAGTVECEAGFNAWVTDGIQVNWTTAPPSAYLVTVVLMKGFANVYVDDCETDDDVTAPAFPPSGVIFGSCWSTVFDNTIQSGGALIGCGLAVNDGSDTQGCWSWGRAWDGFVNDIVSVASDGNIVVEHDGSTVTDEFVVGSFDASGFTVTSPVSVFTAWYLAFELDDGDAAEIAFFDTPTSTGSHSVTGLGLTPVLVLTAMNKLTAHDTPAAGTAADSVGVAAMTAATAVSVSHQANSSSSESQSFQAVTAVRLPNGAIGAGITASFTSMDEGGWTLNYTNVNGARKFIALAIGPEIATEQPLDAIERHTTRGVMRGVTRGIS